MKKLLLLFLLCSVGNAALMEGKVYGKRQAELLKAEFGAGGLVAVAMRGDQALDAMIALAIQKLRDAGKGDYADNAESDYGTYYHGYLTRMHLMRDIGDHAPLLQWLADFYNYIEGVLGVKTCKSLHLSDIKTFNFAVPVVFHPCTFPMDNVKGTKEQEYQRHFAMGAVYDGLIPVIVYWVVDIACMIATYGTSAGGVCGIAADAAEYLMAHFIAPPLSNRIYESQNCPVGMTIKTGDLWWDNVTSPFFRKAK